MRSQRLALVDAIITEQMRTSSRGWGRRSRKTLLIRDARFLLYLHQPHGLPRLGDVAARLISADLLTDNKPHNWVLCTKTDESFPITDILCKEHPKIG